MLVSPAFAHHGQEGLHVQAFAGAALVPAERIPAVQDDLGDPFGIANRVSDGHRSSLRYAEKRVRPQTECIDNSVQIMLERLEGDIGNVPIGKPVAPAVIANEAEAIGEEMV